MPEGNVFLPCKRPPVPFFSVNIHAFPQFPRRCRRQKLPVLRKKRNPLHFLPVRIVQQLKRIQNKFLIYVPPLYHTVIQRIRNLHHISDIRMKLVACLFQQRAVFLPQSFPRLLHKTPIERKPHKKGDSYRCRRKRYPYYPA